MDLSFGFNPLLLLLCLTAAAGLTYWLYHRTVPEVPAARRAVLMSLRFVVLFIVLFLLFEPVWRRVERTERPPVMAVLIDDSESLTIGAEGDSAGVMPRETVRDLVASLPAGLGEDEVRFYAFSEATRRLPDGATAFDSLGFGGARTDIAQALDYVRDELKDANLQGVLLLSDGLYNTGRNPLYTAERYPVPIYTAVLGDTTSRRDLLIRHVTTNEIAYVDAELPIQVGLRAEGFGGEQVVVSLLQDGEVLDAESVRLPEGTAEMPVDLQHTPREEGLKRWTVSVTHLSGETTTRNNSESITVRVLESKRRILLVGAAPGPDFAGIRQVLASDPTSRVSAYVQKGPGTFYEGAFPAVLDTFDVVVLAGFPGRGADTGAVRRVAQAAEAGMPLLFLLTRQTDLNALRQAFSASLPVLPDAVRSGFAEAVFVPTPAGTQHPVLSVPGTNPVLWGRLPPLLYNTSRWQATPDARILATTEVRGVALDDPLLVIRSRGSTRSAALLGAGTWRWKNVPSDLEAAAPLWPGLLSNLVQWVATRENDRLVRVEPVRDLFGGGEDVLLTGQVYDESLNAVDDASVEVEVTAPNGTTYPYVMEAIGNGRYTLNIGTMPEGTYRYTAGATRNDVSLGTDNGSFAVGALTLEFKESQADAPLMRQIAQRSGGAFLPAPAVPELPERLERDGSFAPFVIEEERSAELWHLYGFLIVVVLLLSTEWLLRKRSGMV